MKTFFQIATLGTILLAAFQSAVAIQASGQVAPSAATAVAAGIVERGGTINLLDMEKKIIIVDGVKFPFSTAAIKIHFPATKGAENKIELNGGTQIRFHTSIDAKTHQEQIREIWVLRRGRERSTR